MIIWVDNGENYDDQDRPYMEFVERENPVVATLLGPDGSPLIVLHERPHVPFGFR